MFAYQFTRKKNNDLTSAGDASEMLNNTNTPIGKFKVAVCRQMQKLAEISCDGTINLVHKWFSHH